jgi:hypothetical protein
VTHWRALIERDFLGSWDLVGKDGKSRDFVLEIAGVKSTKVYSQKSKAERGRVTLTFRGGCCAKPGSKCSHKSLIVGAVNCDTIESMYGSDIEAWVGRLIALYGTTTNVGKKKGIPCVRIRPTVPRGKVDAEVPNQDVDPASRAKQDEAFQREPGED